MNYEDVLKEIGLGKNEIKVYISLLQTPNLGVNDIASKSDVHRVNVYDSTKNLQKKGLITEINQGNKKIFRATEPKQLFSIIETKQEKLTTIMPQLNAFYEQTENQAQIFEGIDGIKHILNDMLETAQPINAFGIPKEMPEKLNSFLTTFHRKRIEKNIPIKHIYNENAKKRINYLKKLKKSDAKYLPPEFNVPATTVIYGDKITFWIWSEEPFNILIKSEKMAEAYNKYFELLWKLAK
jgi:sugar-specific transcriptional regulator TrmB